jgi:VRR-NUC domain
MSGARHRRRSRPESDIQEAVCEHLRTRGRPGLVWFAVPNGGSRDVREAINLKRHGVTPGVADIVLLHDSKFFALELKTEQGRLSGAQRTFLAAVNEAGGFGAHAHGLDRAIATLEAWELLRGHSP